MCQLRNSPRSQLQDSNTEKKTKANHSFLYPKIARKVKVTKGPQF